jgi:hypothetical protein
MPTAQLLALQSRGVVLHVEQKRLREEGLAQVTECTGM